jgi:cellulose synthase/poly-beta-1,6-N-acetylglucosamine synthase-like glycosyltransferase
MSKIQLSKTPLMHLTFIVSWLLILLWFNPRLFSLLSQVNSISAKTTLILFVLCLNVFWLFGTYYIMLFVFAILSKKTSALSPLKSNEQPKVAILYLTMNDFQYQAAFSCANQDYQNYHLFILDDGTEEHRMKEVDRFRERFPEKVTVIRRKNRKGFKAGSINNALRNLILDFPYFAVIDSDGVIPKDFLSRLMPYFRLDESIGFVQGSHRPNPIQKSKFASDLALGIIPLWTAYFEPRNHHGFVIFLGHGGIIRRDVWEMIRGFPEVVSEDIAFSTKIAELGYRGYYVRDIISYEDFPETYPQLRKQQEKYVKGGCEYLHKYSPSFLKSKRITWFEKLDVLLSCSTLFLPAFYIFFLFVFCLVLPLFFAEVKPLHLSLFDYRVSIGSAYTLKESFNSIWHWDFYVATLLMMFAPMLSCFELMLSHPIKLIRLLFLSTVPYLSLMVVCITGILTYILTGKAAFLVTGDKRGEVSLYDYPARGAEKYSWLEGLNFQHRVVRIAELALGLFFIYLCLRTLNLSLLAFSLSLTLGYFVFKFGWDNRILKPLLYLPLSFIISAMVLLGFNLMGVQGIFFFFFAIHF